MRILITAFLFFLLSVNTIAKPSPSDAEETPSVINGPLKVNNGSLTLTNGSLSLTNGSIKITNNSNNYIILKIPDTSGKTTYILPGPDGTDGQILATNGNGELKWITPNRTKCPEDYTLIGTPGEAENFCISSQREPATTWLKSIEACYNKTPKAHLCTASEWATLCISDKKFTNTMTGHWEWVADSGSNYGRIMGLAACDSMNGAQVDSKYPYRCCFR